MATAPESVTLQANASGAAEVGWPGALAFWHLCSLDAPTVAVTWTWFVGHCFGVTVSAAVLAAMFVGVWVLYASDRLLDGAAAATDRRETRSGLERRHLFHTVHRRRFFAGIAVALCILGCCLVRFGLAELVVYMLLGAALSLWFGLVHGLSTARSLRLPKELAVGFFFPAAVCIPALLGSEGARTALVAPMVLFGCLCAANGLFIRRWEQGCGKTQAGPLTGFLLRLLPDIAFTTLLLPLIFLACRPHGPASANAAPVEVAIALSAGALLTLNRLRERIEATRLRALADLVLLSPLLVVLFLP